MSKLIEQLYIANDDKTNGMSYVVDRDNSNDAIGIVFWCKESAPLVRSIARDLTSNEMLQIVKILKSHESKKRR